MRAELVSSLNLVSLISTTRHPAKKKLDILKDSPEPALHFARGLARDATPCQAGGLRPDLDQVKIFFDFLTELLYY